MKSASIFLVSLAALLGGAAHAQTADKAPVLVELFSSQNCRACPAVHKTLKAVDAARDDLLVLTWSVDYWDYLGDADPMAIQDSKDRQNAYVERFGLRGPYTPQTVYNGIEQCPGNKPRNVNAAVLKVNGKKARRARLTSTGEQWRLSGEVEQSAEIWFVEYLSDRANSTDMLNPVTEVTLLGSWSGADTALTLPVCKNSCAVVVQETGYGAVLAAAIVSP